jgi:putative FmdB family regulatory protein
MPLYEYQCKKCKHTFEKIQKFSDPEVKKCPECGGPVEKLISAPAVQFKGTGWYVTDYAKSGSGSGSKSAKDDPPAESSASETKTEKSEDKKPAKKSKR